MKRLVSALAAIVAGVVLTLASAFLLLHCTLWLNEQPHGWTRALSTAAILVVGSVILVASVWVAVRIAVALAPSDEQEFLSTDEHR
ncbi:MAG TPA: hypothetical protein VGA40_08735 [Candidatus Acidoferrales bacterium]